MSGALAECIIDCPYCRAELTVAEASPRHVCPQCRHELDVPAQVLFGRGRDLLVQAQEEARAAPAGRRKSGRDPRQSAMLPLLQRGYSALQEAAQRDLAEEQYDECIQMMADAGRTLSTWEKIPVLEARYWATLMMELTTRREIGDLQGKLAGRARQGVLGLPWRWRWRSRRSQLDRALLNIARQLERLEQEGDFVNPPLARYWARKGGGARPLWEGKEEQ